MISADSTRRAFLADAGRAVASGWLALPFLAALTSCARDDAPGAGTATGTVLKAEEARTMSAFAAQILPADADSPGANDLGAVQFIDRVLLHPYFAAMAPLIRGGVADLDVRARAIDSSRDFASLGGAQQIAIMKAIETTPFFKAARTLVVSGTFAEPSYGGNIGGAGWKMLGIDHQPSYVTPFGWYDAHAEAA